MIKDITVHIDGSKVGASRLAFAMDLAKRHRANLTVAHVMPSPESPATFKPSLLGRASEVLTERYLENAKEAKQLFDRETHGHDFPVFWCDLSGDMASTLTTVACCADLVILGQTEWQSPVERHPRALAESVVLNCGRPVLVVPAAIASANFRKALIAWDGSREAVRAVHDAIPILRLANALIEIVTINAVVGAECLADHLKRHDLRLSKAHRATKNGTVGETLVDSIKQGHFDLLVMGAYTQPAWLELLFGGATRSALRQASVPVLVSH